MNPARPDLARLRRSVLAAFAVLGILPGCQTYGAPAQPARMVDPSVSCLNELQQFAETATGQHVTLTAASFAELDELILERRPLRSADGRLLDGRSMDRPQSLRLMQRNDSCVVIHPKSGLERVLSQCRCEALGP
jgi:hypothetical protein